MILEFDLPEDGPITEEDYEEVHRLRHPSCAADCETELCMCPMDCGQAALEVAPGKYICNRQGCLDAWREQQAGAVAS